MMSDNILLSKLKIIRPAINGIIIPLLIYFLIFWLPVPQEIGLAIKYGFFPIILVVIFYYFLCLYFSKHITVINFILVLVLFGLTLTGLWNSGLSVNYTIGGFLPTIGDNFEYYLDAKILLEGGLFSEKSSNRPLFPVCLAFLLSVTNQNLQLTLILLTFITGVCCFILMCEIERTTGWMAGLMLFLIVFLYYRNWIGFIFTENLGLALGLLALALLWRGTWEQNIKVILFGLFLLVLGLNARAGAFFILPMIIFWGAYVLYNERSDCLWRFLIGSTVTVLAGFAVNYFTFKLVGSTKGVPFANFAHVLYGLVTGTYWGQVEIDHPELSSFSVDVKNVKQIYTLTLQYFLNSPLTLFFSLLDKWLSYLLPTSNGIFTFIQPHYVAEKFLAYAVRLFFYLLSLIGLVYCYTHRKNHLYSLILFSNIGIWLSAPFLPDMGRTVGTTIPFIAALACCGVMGIQQFNQNLPRRLRFLISVPKSADAVIPNSGLVYLISTGLAGVLCFYPLFIQRYQSTPPVVIQNPCELKDEAVYVRLTSGSGIQLVEDDFVSQTKIPFIRISDFLHGNVYTEQMYFFDYFTGVKAGMSIITAFNLVNPNQKFHLVVNSSLLPNDKGVVGVCGHQTGPVFFASSLFEPIHFPATNK